MTDTKWLRIRSEPASGATGASPDIILGGPKPDPAWTPGYDQTFNQTSNYINNSYVYVRAKNDGAKLAIASATVWVARLGDLTTPGKWLKLSTSDGRGSVSIGAEPGDVTTTGSPLIWPASGPPAPGAPYCLIAEVTGDGYPAEGLPSSVKTQADFDAFVTNSSRMAYLVVKDAPVVTKPAPTFTWTLPISLENDDPVRLGLGLTCTTGPAGGSLAYALDKPDSSGSAIGVGKTAYTIGSAYSQNRIVDADFSANITVTFQPASSADVHGEFDFQVTTLPAKSGSSHRIDHPTLVAEYSVVFGETKTA